MDRQGTLCVRIGAMSEACIYQENLKGEKTALRT